LQRSSRMRKLRDRFFPWMRGYHVRKALRTSPYTTVEAKTDSGKKRNFEIYDAFSSLFTAGAIHPSLDELTSLLGGYE